ncbi:hypothetical protein [Mesorhizobium sp. KR9-304]|uniref:hypothetical protein n=1 Tax=Mesorhizobium sp. KR9-304 TaxID=3156614 RepID=UPI0032B438B2
MVRISSLFSTVFCALIVLCNVVSAEEEKKPKTASEMIYGQAEKLVLGAIPGVEDLAKPVIEAIKKEIISIETAHSTTATFVGDGSDVHVGVGDVYQLNVKLFFKRETRLTVKSTVSLTWKPVNWTYGYDVFVGDKLAYSQTLVTRQPTSDATGIFVWGEEYSVTKSIYLLASSLENSDCQGEGSAIVTIRSWIKEEARTQTKEIDFPTTKYGPWKQETTEVAESSSVKSAGNAAGAGQLAIVIHNPWSIGFEEFPTKVNHSNASYNANIDFSLKQRRDFPLFNIGSPPSEMNLITRITQNSSAHFDLKARKPREGHLSFGDKSELLFLYPYHFEQGVDSHFPNGGDQKITFSLEAELVGERQLKAGRGQKFEWRVYPKIVTPTETVCGRFVWDVVDQEEINEVDPCLVGSWVATEVAFLDQSLHFRTGGTGFRVTFAADGIQTTDYSTMAPIVIGNDAWRFKGTAYAAIKTKEKTAKIQGEIGGPGVLVHLSAKFPEMPYMPTLSLGPGGLGSTEGDNKYVCEKDTLSYKTSIGKGMGAARSWPPQFAVKLKRQAG